jgi:hypothetical protein
MASLLGGKQREGKATTIPSINLAVQKMDQTTSWLLMSNLAHYSYVLLLIVNTSKRRRKRRKRRAAKMGMDYGCNDFGDDDIADEKCDHGVRFGNMCLPDTIVETMTPENSIMASLQ